MTFLSQFYQVKSKRPVPTRESHGWKEMCADAVTVIPNCAQRIKKRQHKTSTGTARQKCVRAHWYLVPCRQVFPVIPSPRSSLRLQQKRPMRNVSLTRHLPVGLFFFHFIQMFPSSHFPFHSIPFHSILDWKRNRLLWPRKDAASALFSLVPNANANALQWEGFVVLSSLASQPMAGGSSSDRPSRVATVEGFKSPLRPHEQQSLSRTCMQSSFFKHRSSFNTEMQVKTHCHLGSVRLGCVGLGWVGLLRNATGCLTQTACFCFVSFLSCHTGNNPYHLDSVNVLLHSHGLRIGSEWRRRRNRTQDAARRVQLPHRARHHAAGVRVPLVGELAAQQKLDRQRTVGRRLLYRIEQDQEGYGAGVHWQDPQGVLPQRRLSTAV